MYAEDIDLSYRLEKAGYPNYYFADTTIVHFKGESTRKDIRYIRQFYKAMIQFRRKHFKRAVALSRSPGSRHLAPRRPQRHRHYPHSHSPPLQTPPHLAHRRSPSGSPACKPRWQTSGTRTAAPDEAKRRRDHLLYRKGIFIQISHPGPRKEKARRKLPLSTPKAAMPSSAAPAATISGEVWMLYRQLPDQSLQLPPG